jgi:hypothetical protein
VPASAHLADGLWAARAHPSTIDKEAATVRWRLG